LLLHVPGFPREYWYPGDGWAEALQPGVRVCPPSGPGRPLSVILTPESFEVAAPCAELVAGLCDPPPLAAPSGPTPTAAR
jgi:hypothetical protein